MRVTQETDIENKKSVLSAVKSKRRQQTDLQAAVIRSSNLVLFTLCVFTHLPHFYSTLVDAHFLTLTELPKLLHHLYRHTQF